MWQSSVLNHKVLGETFMSHRRKGDTAMSESTVVGSVSKPSPEKLLAMYKTLDNQTKEIRRQFEEGVLTPADIQAVIEHRGQVIVVVSDGLPVEQSITNLKTAGFDVWPEAKFIMRSGVVTNGVTYRVGIINGDEFEDNVRTTENIRKEADRRRWTEPPAELARLLLEKLSDEDLRMGLWLLMVMHKPIPDSDGNPRLLGLGRDGGGRKLDAYYGRPVDGWGRRCGFAFLV